MTSLLLQTITGQSKSQCTPESWGGDIEPHLSMGGESKNLWPSVTQQPTTPSISRVYVYTYLSRVKNDGIWDLKGTLKTISFDILIVQRSKAQRDLTPWNTATHRKGKPQTHMFQPQIQEGTYQSPTRVQCSPYTRERETMLGVLQFSMCKSLQFCAGEESRNNLSLGKIRMAHSMPWNSMEG